MTLYETNFKHNLEFKPILHHDNVLQDEISESRWKSIRKIFGNISDTFMDGQTKIAENVRNVYAFKSRAKVQ